VAIGVGVKEAIDIAKDAVQPKNEQPAPPEVILPPGVDAPDE
jgi:hypothetical protein